MLQNHKGTGKGSGKRRNVEPLSFRSLRKTATTLSHEAGNSLGGGPSPNWTRFCFWVLTKIPFCVQKLMGVGNCGQSSDDSRISGRLEKWNLRVPSRSQIQTSHAPASK